MVTFKVSETTPQLVKINTRYDHYLSDLSEFRGEGCTEILQGTEWSKDTFCPRASGLVSGVIEGYNNHHNLVIRPDDVWLAITIQFGLYVNANAEALRSVFVDHEGKKELTVSAAGHLHSADYGSLASKMSMELHKNVKDPELCSWILPGFSTTTKNDVIVGSVVLMATLKSYFDYRFQLLCGIPYVTLLGTPEDWEEINNRVGRLSLYGKECERWSVMLKEITEKLVESSKGNVDVEFWRRICHYTAGGSGPSYVSGWISAFCVFDKAGKWQGDSLSRRRRTFAMRCRGEVEEVEAETGVIAWPDISTDDIPPGYLTVDVVVDDSGKEYKTLMFAGHMGYDAVEDGKAIAPKVTWAIVLKDEEKKKAAAMV